jgi:hypothetical protein
MLAMSKHTALGVAGGGYEVECLWNSRVQQELGFDVKNINGEMSEGASRMIEST